MYEENPDTPEEIRSRMAGNARPSQGEGCEQRRHKSRDAWHLIIWGEFVWWHTRWNGKNPIWVQDRVVLTGGVSHEVCGNADPR